MRRRFRNFGEAGVPALLPPEEDGWYGSSWYVSEASDSSVSTKPIPGERAEPVGWGVASVSRRQERAKTPVRRMVVPRAI